MKFKEIAVSSLKALCGNNCGICGLPLDGDVDIDHIIPVSFGGLDSYDNLRIVHSSCHKKRHATLNGVKVHEKLGEQRIKDRRRKYTGRPGKPISEAKRIVIMEIGKLIEGKRNEGKNITRIAEEMGISRPTIYEYMRKYEREKTAAAG